MRKWFQKLAGRVSHDIGIDLGTANTLVYVRGKGIVINEPAVVAVNQKTGQVVAIGKAAKEMIGRTPQHITAIRPLVEGVISNFEVTEEMLSYLLSKAQEGSTRFFGPRVVVGVPSGITNVEIRAVRDAAKNAGAREVFIIEEPMAAALGERLPIEEARGMLIVDIGGGTTDIALISLSGVVVARNVRIAGDHFNVAIVNFVRDQFKLLIGEKTAEELKHAVFTLEENPEPIEAVLRGRDLVSGLPREIVVTDAEVRDALVPHLDAIVQTIATVLESSPPDILADVLQSGLYLTGGGSMIPGLESVLEGVLQLPVRRAHEPLTSVVRGTGILLEEFERYQLLLVSHDDEPVLPDLSQSH